MIVSGDRELLFHIAGHTPLTKALAIYREWTGDTLPYVCHFAGARLAGHETPIDLQFDPNGDNVVTLDTVPQAISVAAPAAAALPRPTKRNELGMLLDDFLHWGNLQESRKRRQ